MKNKFILLILIFITVFINSDELIDKYVADAKSFYIIKDYDKAYNRIKFILKYYNYNENELSTEIKTLSENIYYEYLKNLFNNGNYDAIKTVYNSDPYYLTAEKKSEKILKFKNQIEVEIAKKEKEDEISKKIGEAEKLKKEKEAELEIKIKEREDAYKKELNAIILEQEKLLNLKKEEDKLKDAKLQAQLDRQIEESRRKEEKLENLRENEKKELLEIQKEIIQERMEAENNMQKEMAEYYNKFLLSKEKESKTYFNSIVYIVSLLAGVFAIIFSLIVTIIIVFVKNSHRQHQRYFEYSMKLMEYLPQQNPTNVLSFPLATPPVDSEHFLNATKIKKLAGPISPPDEKLDKLEKIIETCMNYAVEIDQITNRKNCAKNVADIVYKISKINGYSEYECLLHYTVSLVYDIGFLNIDPEILSKPEVNEEEFDIIKTHTSHGLNLIHFIDDDIKEIFIDGVSKHHENLDGSGYPAGLKQNDIPYIARVIRVVETFISLISVRKYRKIIDKESAIQLLLENKKTYDNKIVNILINIV